MTLDEKIAVMQACKRGEEIEQVERTYDNWYRSPFPAWNWNSFLYRVKPKPKQVVVIEKWLCRNNGYFIAQGDKEYLESIYPLSKVKLLDTYEVTL